MGAPRITLSISESQINMVDNSSVLTGTLYYYGNGESWNANSACSININGSVKTFSCNIGKWTSGAIGSHSVKVKHNSDGNKTVNYSASVAVSSYYGTTTTTGTYKCEWIKRATQVALSPAEIKYGQEVTISLPAADTTFKHILYYSTGDGLKTIAGNVGSEYKWIVPMDLARTAINEPIKGVTIYAETYTASGTFIASTNALLSVRPADSMTPKVGVTISDTTNNFSKYGSFIKGQSVPQISLSETLSYDSPIKLYDITVDGVRYNTPPPLTTPPISKVGEPIVVKVVDGRGMSGGAALTPDILDWWTPELTNVKLQRCSPTGVIDDQGEYIRVDYSLNIAPLGAKSPNTKLLQISVKEQGAPSFGTPILVTPDAYKASGFKVIKAVGNSAYDVRIEVSDDFASVCIDKQVGTSFVLMNWNASGKGMAIGKVSENDYFEVGVFSEFVGGYGSGSDTTAKMASFAEVGAGGRKSFTESEGIGILKIILPGEFSKRTILKFDVDIYSYGRSSALTYTVGGQIYNNRDGTPSWYRSTAGVKTTDSSGPIGSTTVCFGAEGNNPAISFGDKTTAWGVSQVVIRNLQTSNNMYGVARWADGWIIKIEQTPLSTILNTVNEVNEYGIKATTIKRLESLGWKR